MANKPKRRNPAHAKSKAQETIQWHEQRIDIAEHRGRLKELQGPRAGVLGWILALAGMLALLALLNKNF